MASTPKRPTQEMQRSKEIEMFSPSHTPNATEGPAARWLKHEVSLDILKEGLRTARAVAVLLKELGVGQSGSQSSLDKCHEEMRLVRNQEAALQPEIVHQSSNLEKRLLRFSASWKCHGVL
ncbi:uncharacterized protein [Littorina saxatilis]|uniref:uncharacterized protein n=1 Tax=Littorina saxatilis TaxID=31220 RepID=UPI0038B59BCB